MLVIFHLMANEPNKQLNYFETFVFAAHTTIFSMMTYPFHHLIT